MAAPDYAPNTAQRRLAEEVTRFVHGEEGLQQAIKATQVTRCCCDAMSLISGYHDSNGGNRTV